MRNQPALPTLWITHPADPRTRPIRRRTAYHPQRLSPAMAGKPFRAPGDTTSDIDNIGPHSFWGFTPPINLQARKSPIALADWEGGEGEGDGASATAVPLNILVVGAADPRHLLRTIAERRRFSKRPLHFFVSRSGRQ